MSQKINKTENSKISLQKQILFRSTSTIPRENFVGDNQWFDLRSFGDLRSVKW